MYPGDAYYSPASRSTTRAGGDSIPVRSEQARWVFIHRAAVCVCVRVCVRVRVCAGITPVSPAADKTVVDLCLLVGLRQLSERLPGCSSVCMSLHLLSC